MNTTNNKRRTVRFSTTRLLASACFLALASFTVPSAAQAQAVTASAEERAACTPDVFRLCSSEIPNVTRIIACMKRERPKLSPACAAFFNVRAGAPQTATRSTGAPTAN